MTPIVHRSEGFTPFAPQETTETRATQTLVAHMGFCWSHPSLTVIEVAWRWLFGIPFLLVLWAQYQQILVSIPPDSAGLNRLDSQNPFASAVVFANAAGLYAPAVAAVLSWFVPVAVIIWSIVSGLGRALVLHRFNRLGQSSPVARILPRIPSIIALQMLWVIGQLAFFYLWYRSVSWASATFLTESAEPNLVGYLCWLIFFSLGFFILWGVLSWALTIAPILLTEENCSLPQAISRSFGLGKPLTSKLVEINLVMSIVRIALIVLAMVFCAAPLPFSDQFGPTALNGLYVVIVIAFLLGNDYFQVVRLKSFQFLRQHYRAGKN